jgi:protein required for attachment to host cells
MATNPQTQRRRSEHVQWIVITDHVEARIWARRGGEAPQLVESLQHPAGHLREQDIVSDEPGRMTARGRGHTQTMQQRGSARHNEQLHFAAAVGDHLSRALEQGLYDELALVAAPRWLGELRDQLDRRVRDRVVAEVHHSLMHDRVEDVAARIDAERQPRPLA